jgi:hypothetical protein
MDKEKYIIDLVVAQWERKLKQIETLLDTLGEGSAQLSVAPGRNQMIYIMGHLIAVSDRMYKALYLGERFYPELDELFVKPQTSAAKYPDYNTLKAQWDLVHHAIANEFKFLSVRDWLAKHIDVSEEDFIKEPNRNRLNYMLTRLAHHSQHYGQLLLIK